MTDRLRRLNEKSRSNAAKSSLIAFLLDAVPGMNDLVLGTLTGESVDLKSLASDPERLAEHIRENVGGVFHPTGTCRMGPAEDQHAVVDGQGRVHGIAGLRVADAAIMPIVMAGNTRSAPSARPETANSTKSHARSNLPAHSRTPSAPSYLKLPTSAQYIGCCALKS